MFSFSFSSAFQSQAQLCLQKTSKTFQLQLLLFSSSFYCLVSDTALFTQLSLTFQFQFLLLFSLHSCSETLPSRFLLLFLLFSFSFCCSFSDITPLT